MTTEMICAEVVRLKGQLDGWEAEVAALYEKINPAKKELEHWNGILQLRRPEQPTLDLDTEEPMEGDARVSQHEPDGPAEYGAKARALRAFVRSNAQVGVTMSELVREAVRLGSHGNSAYRFAGRLTRTNPPELERKGDRYFPTDRMK